MRTNTVFENHVKGLLFNGSLYMRHFGDFQTLCSAQ